MYTLDITDRLIADTLYRKENPEGVTVECLSSDHEVARLLGAKIAQRLFPDRHFGRVLLVEDHPADVTTLVTVEDLGKRAIHTTAGAIRASDRPSR